MEGSIYGKHLIRSFMGIDIWEHALMNIIWAVLVSIGYSWRRSNLARNVVAGSELAIEN